ncbi:hypothetical protein GG344DRAFT_84645 [Lentinula edodes]|nr:hypothetical protein GG344DRAFT_84645 [Lentinula edodes]
MKSKGKAKAQPVGEDPDDGDDGDEDDDDEEDREPCESGVASSVSPATTLKYDVRTRVAHTPSRGREAQVRAANGWPFSKYLRQLLRRQEDDHARLISLDTRVTMMGMGEGPATAGPSRKTTERRRLLKRRRVVEESEEEGEEEEDREVEEKETEKDGEGEEELIEEETAPTEAQSVKGKGKEVVVVE